MFHAESDFEIGFLFFVSFCMHSENSAVKATILNFSLYVTKKPNKQNCNQIRIQH